MTSYKATRNPLADIPGIDQTVFLIDQQCDRIYYLSEINNNGNAMFTDVTNHVDKIFAKLSKPLQRLEDEEWNIDEL